MLCGPWLGIATKALKKGATLALGGVAIAQTATARTAGTFGISQRYRAASAALRPYAANRHRDNNHKGKWSAEPKGYPLGLMWNEFSGLLPVGRRSANYPGCGFSKGGSRNN